MRQYVRNIANYIKVVCAVVLLCITAHSAFGQSAGEPTLPERIEAESEGDIVITMSDDFYEDLMSQPQTAKKGVQPVRPGVNNMSGYRIQVFSDGRGQHNLEARAKARGNAIIAKFPKYRGQVYTFSKSPNWYTRVGNFRTQGEANTALMELKRAFPGFASEMRIVKSRITVIK